MNRGTPLLLLCLACSPVDGQGNDAGAGHEPQIEVEAAVAEALNDPEGADYRRAIAAVEGSARPRPIKDLQIGDIILSAYRDGPPGRMPRQSASDALDLLERASGGSEAAAIAPQHLQLWFERGAGSALAPNPRLATCWRKVVQAAARAAECIALRPRP